MNQEEGLRHREFLRCFTAHEPAIRAYVRRMVPLREDAGDVMQDVAVVLWEKYGQFREGGDFRAWAFGVARYEVLAWRRDKARNRLVLSEEVIQMVAVESDRDEPRLARQRELLESCLGQLEVPQRDILMNAYQPLARISELAERSGRSVAGFYQWLYRIRRLLVDCVRRELAREALP